MPTEAEKIWDLLTISKNIFFSFLYFWKYNFPIEHRTLLFHKKYINTFIVVYLLN